MTLTLGHILNDAEIDPSETVVLRHRPFEPSLRRVFGGIARTRPDLFKAYQSIQGQIVQSGFQCARWVVSCLGEAPGEAFLIGVYEIAGGRLRRTAQIYQSAAFQELIRLGMKTSHDTRREIVEFDLRGDLRFEAFNQGWFLAGRVWSAVGIDAPIAMSSRLYPSNATASVTPKCRTGVTSL